MEYVPQILELFKGFNPMVAGLLAILALFGLTLYRIHVKPDSFDLRDLIRDDKTNKPSIFKVGQVVTLIVSTWGFIYLVTHDRFTEFYFIIYMAIWSGSEIAKDMVNRGRVVTTESTVIQSNKTETSNP